MKNRIKEIRKSLGLTQKQFANRLGMKQNTIATYEIGRGVPSLRTINNICNEFNVRQEWLKTGSGEIFEKADRFNLDTFLKQNKATKLELNIVKAYFDLDPEIRELIIHSFRRRIYDSQSYEPPSYSDGLDSPHKYVHTDEEIEAEVADYRHELIEEKRAREKLSASQDLKEG